MVSEAWDSRQYDKVDGEGGMCAALERTGMKMEPSLDLDSIPIHALGRIHWYEMKMEKPVL